MPGSTGDPLRSGNQDDSFLPELTSDLEPAGEAVGAPGWESERVGSNAVLRLGNSDGTLASVVTFQNTGYGWRRVLTTKCSNDATAGKSTAALITSGLPPPGSTPSPKTTSHPAHCE